MISSRLSAKLCPGSRRSAVPKLHRNPNIRNSRRIRFDSPLNETFGFGGVRLLLASVSQ